MTGHAVQQSEAQQPGVRHGTISSLPAGQPAAGPRWHAASAPRAAPAPPASPAAKMQILGQRASWWASSTGCTKQFGAQEWLKKAPTLRFLDPHATNLALKGLQGGGGLQVGWVGGWVGERPGVLRNQRGTLLQ